VETSEGRIPVPEGGTSIGTPAAAYSLRNLSTTYTGNVVDVRRSSDDAEDSFTAAEVADGTLTDWVSEAPIAQNSTSNPYTTFTNASNTGFTATLSSGVAFAGFGNVEGSSGDSVTVSFDLDVVSGSPSVALREGLGDIASKSNLETNLGNGSYSLTLNATANFGFIGFSEGDIPSEFTVSNFEITSVSGATYVRDGFVSKWYDQSGNDNHATQGTDASQPKIVDAGSLVSGGLDFDGVDDRLTCPSLYSSDISIFNVATTSNTVNTGNYMRMVHLCDGSDSFQLTRGGGIYNGELTSKNTAFQSGATGFRHGNINGEHLISAVTSSTDTDAFIDGSLQSNESVTLGSGNSTTTTIGARDDLNSSAFFAGSHAEIIIYPSDQSANRPAIETNINDHYNIY